jgi:serine/threonine protein kinase/Tol biopolymer transport system component
MSLSAGIRLGPYEILSALGAGGMGEVYRARDTKLGRDVAIKVLPDALAHDPERLARFEREAKTLAALNHPNIAHIHGFEDSTAVPALVMELVEGPTLADRIATGARPIDETLKVAAHIADALAAAHEKGIVHRDLKPANVKITPDGVVKVLDFGLAKAAGGESTPDLSQSPTLAGVTRDGIILGTAPYMSPEQAKGRPVDKRTDLWAFGAVLYELLTGRRAFTGEGVSDTLAHVLMTEPDWTALPANTPASIRRLLRRCLEKDRKRRLADAADARLEIDDALASPTVETAAPADMPSRRVAPVPIAFALASGALIAALAMWAVTRPAPRALVSPSRFAIVPPPGQSLAISSFFRDLALSPDGRYLVYRAGGTVTGGPLMVRAMDALDAQPLAGITTARNPFFSPDSRWIGFFDNDELKKVSVTGGPAITISRLVGPGPRGASWGDDNTIVFATNDPKTGLLRVSADGGEPTVLTTPDASQHEGDHLFPSVLPGGRGVLFTITAGQAENTQLAVLDLKTGQRKTLLRGGSAAEYVETGHLIYAAAGTLRAVRFDLARLEVLSDPVPAVEYVIVASTGAANYAVSRSGTLVYAPGDARARSLVWVDRQGHETPIKAPPRAYAIPRLSPDGTRIALDIRDQENDIWIWDLARETLTRLTSDPGLDAEPVWTPDGRRLLFSSTRMGVANLYGQAADGTGTADRLTSSTIQPTSVTPDGTRVVGSATPPKTQWHVVLSPLASSASRAGHGPSPGPGLSRVEPLIQTPFIERNAEVSPDGHFLAYESNESGRNEIYVRPFPEVERGRWQVSTGGGTQAAWARNGRELFYLDGSNRLTAVPVQTTGATFSAGNPIRLFDRAYTTPVGFRTYDVSPDGQRFLMIKEDQNATTPGMVVVEHWSEELKARVPTK